MPIIVLDRYLDVARVDAIRVDDGAGLMASITHLASMGHRRIWCADGGDFVSAEPRRTAYLDAMRAHGLAHEAHVMRAGGSEMDGALCALRMIEEGDLPTAVVAYNDRAACGFVDVLWRNGVRVPEDISVVGFDNINVAGMPHIDLTTVEQRADCLVAAASETLMARLEGAPPGGLRLLPPGGLIVRGSSGPARPGGRVHTLAG